MSYVSSRRMKLYIDEYTEKVLKNKFASKNEGSPDNNYYTKEDIDNMIGGIESTLDDVIGA